MCETGKVSKTDRFLFRHNAIKHPEASVHGEDTLSLAGAKSPVNACKSVYIYIYIPCSSRLACTCSLDPQQLEGCMLCRGESNQPSNRNYLTAKIVNG